MSEHKKSVTKRIEYSYNSIMTAKFRNFRKKSFRNYTLSCVLYALGITVIRGGELLSLNTLMIFVNFFLIVMSLVMIMIFGSSWLLARKLKGNSNVYTFSADGIHILNEANKEEDTLGWDWIRSYEITRQALCLQINTKKPLEIILEKEKISQEEIELITSWIDQSR
ncbi:MAG: hypothetical protein PQJ58_21025 [Spirochaetales bacterium]|nr:hypothetical protein [Spirochaetales bacterium]